MLKLFFRRFFFSITACCVFSFVQTSHPLGCRRGAVGPLLKAKIPRRAHWETDFEDRPIREQLEPFNKAKANRRKACRLLWMMTQLTWWQFSRTTTSLLQPYSSFSQHTMGTPWNVFHAKDPICKRGLIKRTYWMKHTRTIEWQECQCRLLYFQDSC